MSDHSMQERAGRVRPPRVHITYEVHVGDAKEQKEIPFVAGVLADLSGDREKPLPAVEDREFAELNPDTFKKVFREAAPRLQLTVNNVIGNEIAKAKLPGEERASSATTLTGDIKFESLDDFDPKKVASQITPLKELLELRDILVQIQGHLQTNRNLDRVLEQVLNNPQTQERWRQALGSL